MRYIKEYKEIDWSNDGIYIEEDSPTKYEFYILKLYSEILFFIKDGDRFYCLHFIDEDKIDKDEDMVLVRINNHDMYCVDYFGSYEYNILIEVDEFEKEQILSNQLYIYNDFANGDDRYFYYENLKDIVDGDISFKYQ